MAKRETKPAYAKLARKGEVAEIFALADNTPKSPNDRLAYKWLSAAVDFGHEDAEDLIDEMMEVTSLRNDDEGYETAAAHWELAVAYLTGEEGLPVHLARAENHLQQAFERHDLSKINAGANETYSAEPLLERLAGRARDLLAFELAGGDPSRRVLDRVVLIEKLVACGAPKAMVDGQKRLLRKAAHAFFARNLPGSEALRERVSAILQSAG